MNDTPRTDAAYFEPGATMYDLAGEMKRIERELNAANEKIEVLLISDCERLRIENELAAANERIKRLEEFARTIENDFDHDEDAHRYGTTCRVCDAEDLLKETKIKEDKP